MSATAPNSNQGGESTLAYHQALLSLVASGLVKLPEPVAVETGPPMKAARSVVTSSRTRTTTEGPTDAH